MNPGDDRKRKPDGDDEPDGRKNKKVKLPYEINEVPDKRVFGKKFMRRYKGGMATDTVYDVAITGTAWKGLKITNLTEELTEMWRRVIRTVADDGALPTDLVRIHIGHRDLTKGDIKIPLQQLKDLTPEAIMDRIATIMQSFEHLRADNILEISVGVIKFPHGHAAYRTKQKIISLDKLDGKKSVTLINNDDKKCLARSLAVSEAWERKKEWEETGKGVKMTTDMWRNFIKTASIKQLTRADELIRAAGLSVDESGSFAAIPKYEDVLRANIVVIASSHGNKVIYPQKLNPQWESSYYVYYMEAVDGPGHFHSVKTPTALMSVDYFCKSCLQGYKHKHKHRCPGLCNKCKCEDCSPPDVPSPRSCRRCHVEFASQSCFDRHLKQDGKCKTVCDKFWQCRECRRYFDTASIKRENHRCDHYFCKTCDRQASTNGHHCFQRALKPGKPCEKFIFFDFECTQESGEHIPNLVVARKYDLKKATDFQETVFRSDDVRNEFGAWLFSRENKGYVVLAHNMKG